MKLKRALFVLALSPFAWLALSPAEHGPEHNPEFDLAPEQVWARSSPARVARIQDTKPTTPVPTSVPQTPACANPTPVLLQQCEALAERILAATVRLEIWLPAYENGPQLDGSISHGTLKDGRYLVTHNHFELPLERLQQGHAGQEATVSVHTANGEAVLQKYPLTAVKIAYTDSQTMVLDFGAYGGRGLFDIMGWPSARFEACCRLALQPGTEVAQVNWNGRVAQVDWTYVEAIDTEGETPTMQLPNFVTPGASGGGIFWHGRHVGNNWYRATELNGKEKVVRRYSQAALNPPRIGGIMAR